MAGACSRPLSMWLPCLTPGTRRYKEPHVKRLSCCWKSPRRPVQCGCRLTLMQRKTQRCSSERRHCLRNVKRTSSTWHHDKARRVRWQALAPGLCSDTHAMSERP
jgi:hypothetical protein